MIYDKRFFLIDSFLISRRLLVAYSKCTAILIHPLFSTCFPDDVLCKIGILS